MPREVSGTNWSAGVLLDKAESVMCVLGTVQIETDAAPGDDDGHVLRVGQAYELPAGVTLRHKSANSHPAAINRLVIEP